jgi:methyl-accepting chemotaxis protein
MQSYLYQVVEQLQWALQNVDTTNASVVTPVPKSLLPTGITTTPDPQSTFNSIKSLIIKSADIVSAYYQEISRRIEGKYVAQSDFGAFKEETAQSISETSTEVTRAFTNIQEIETNLQETKSGIGSNLDTLSAEVGDLDTSLQGLKDGVDANLKTLTDEIGEVDTAVKEAKTAIGSDLQEVKDAVDALNYSLIEVNANIRSGLLYIDDAGIPVYGLEIGQKNVIDGVEVFNKYARFTAGRLSFYDQNGSEVAYISDFKLYITNAEVTGTLKIGGYLVDTARGLTFKWVGR